MNAEWQAATAAYRKQQKMDPISEFQVPKH